MTHTEEEINKVIRFRSEPHRDSLRTIATCHGMSIEKVTDILDKHAPHLRKIKYHWQRRAS